MSNTVGSREVIPRILKARKNICLRLTQDEFDILVGSILGDGYITKLGKIQIEQGDPQYSYLLWKYRKLRNISYGRISFVRRRKRGGKVTTSHRFWTRQFFRTWRTHFYPNEKKEIPDTINQIFSPLTLAVWYMDDGCLHSKNSIIIATERFSNLSLKNLQNAFLTCYGIDVVVRKNKRICLRKEATKKFLKIVCPFVIPTMRYKLS